MASNSLRSEKDRLDADVQLTKVCELKRKIMRKRFLSSLTELKRHISGNCRCLARLFAVMAFALCFHASSFAQSNRIIGNINTDQWTPLPGHVNANARGRYDQGKVPDVLEMQSVTFVMKPSASQQAALDQLLLDQQNPKSPSYHRWLTPEEYADRFGVSKSDLAKIVRLGAQSQGLTVTGTARARNAVSSVRFGGANWQRVPHRDPYLLR